MVCVLTEIVRLFTARCDGSFAVSLTRQQPSRVKTKTKIKTKTSTHKTKIKTMTPALKTKTKTETEPPSTNIIESQIKAVTYHK